MKKENFIIDRYYHIKDITLIFIFHDSGPLSYMNLS